MVGGTTRKDVNKEVFVYGKQDEEDSSKIVNTMNGCDCIISFDKYDTTTKPDTIGFSVKISRDDEVFYERKGSIPILNEELKDHISIKDNITNVISETKEEIKKSGIVNRWIIVLGFIIIAILQYLFK